MNITNKQKSDRESVILPSSHRLPIFIITIGLIFLTTPFHPIPTIIISGFGLFLLIQSFTLKLQFTKDDLIVLQLGQELRRFPFKNWISWRILGPMLPGLFYFREQASPHLLPILFDPKALESELRLRVGKLEIKRNNNESVINE